MNDSAAKITISSGTLDFASDLVYALTGEADSISGQSLKIATVNGGTVKWDSLSASNFTWNGDALAFRVSVKVVDGVATFEGVAYDLVWNGGSEATWSADAFVDADGNSVAFVTNDNVEFKTAGNVEVKVNEAVSVGTMTISDGNMSFSFGSEGSITATETIVSGTGTLKLSSGGQTSPLRGALTIKDGGYVDFAVNDASGWGGERLQSML